MNVEARRNIRERIRDKKDVWARIFASTLVLLDADRIASSGRYPAAMLGIWGYSYIRTYYMWINALPENATRMEGGIATTFFVLKGLLAFCRVAGVSVHPSVTVGIKRFFDSHVNGDGGIGIRGMSLRGVEQHDTNLRHTCFGYLILRLLDGAAILPTAMTPILGRTAGNLLRHRDAEALLGEWLGESWPVGGIAAYISALEAAHRSEPTIWPSDDYLRWPAVRDALLSAVGQLTSLQLLHLWKEEKTLAECEMRECYPFWHAIGGKAPLRLHSTNGCVALLSPLVADDPVWTHRVGSIAASLGAEVIGQDGAGPRFARDEKPSIAAAFAILSTVLSPMNDISLESYRVVDLVLSFVEKNWANPSVYLDYWSEFSAGVLEIPEIVEEVDMEQVCRFYAGARVTSNSTASPLRPDGLDWDWETISLAATGIGGLRPSGTLLGLRS